MMQPEKRSKLTITLFAVYMLLMIGVILFKLPFYSPVISDGIRVVNLVPFQESLNEAGGIRLSEIIENILIFVPLGAYACMLKKDWSFVKKAVLIIGVSMAFEIIQYIFALGRSDITDVIDNTIGGLLGIGLYGLVCKLFKDKADNIVNVIATILTICVVIYFGYLFCLSHFVMGNVVQ